MNDIKEVLHDLGLDSKEIDLYLVLLRKGESTVLQLSRETGLERTSIYDSLSYLGKKGIVSSIKKNNSSVFMAINPEQLLTLFKDKYSALENILPKLNAIASKEPTDVTCEFFSGKESLKAVARDLLTAKKDYFVIGLKKEYEDVLGFFNDTSILRLNESSVKETALVDKGSKFKKVKNGKYRFLESNVSSNTTTLIYETVVVFFFWSEPYSAIRVKSNDLAKAQKAYFDMLWKQAK